jgi:hypothetical protein
MILFCAIDHQGVVRGRAAEPVPSRYVFRVAAGAGVAENFAATDAQNKTQLVVVSVAPFAMDSIWNGKKEKIRRRLFQNADSRLWNNLDWVWQARVLPRFRIGRVYGVGETVPRGIVTGAGTYAEQPLSET